MFDCRAFDPRAEGFEPDADRERIRERNFRIESQRQHPSFHERDRSLIRSPRYLPQWPNRDRAYFEHDGFASVFNVDIHNNRSYDRFGHFDERDGRPGGRERQCDDLNVCRQPWHEMRDNRNEPREYRCGEDGFYLFREDGLCYDDEGFCYSFSKEVFYYDVEEGRRYDSGGFACDEYGVRFDYADGPREDNGGNLDARPIDPGSPRVVWARKTPPRKRVSIVEPDAEPEDRRRPWRPDDVCRVPCVILEHACDIPRLLVPAASLVTSAQGVSHPLLQSGALKLAAWRLSGDLTVCKGFRCQLSSFSWKGAALTPTRHTNQRETPGVIGVCCGIKIPFLTM
jgi:hypothetical protein